MAFKTCGVHKQIYKIYNTMEEMHLSMRRNSSWRCYWPAIDLLLTCNSSWSRIVSTS